MKSLKINKSVFFLNLLSIISSTVLVYLYFYKYPPPDILTYFNNLESYESNIELLGLNILTSFDLGYLYLFILHSLGKSIFVISYIFILKSVFYITFNKISKNFYLIAVNIIILMIPEYLPSKFLTSTFRQTVSLFLFLFALNQSNNFKRNLLFLLSGLGHFTGLINIACLILSKYFLKEIKLNKYFFYSCFSITFFIIFYGDILMPVYGKIDHYSQIVEIGFSVSKKIVLLFIFVLCMLDFTVFKKMKNISSFIFIFLLIIVLLNNISASISLRLFNSIYFIFPIYCLSLIYNSFTLKSLYERD